MGNLDLREMHGVSGAQGPAVVLRGIFSELERRHEQERLFLSPKLQRAAICSETGLLPAASPDAACPTVAEWFRPGHAPVEVCRRHRAALLADSKEMDRAQPTRSSAWLSQPTPGLHLALDPRIPDDVEAFPLEVSGSGAVRRIEWLIDGVTVGETGPDTRRFLWPLAAGRHEAQARVWTPSSESAIETAVVAFYVR